MITEHIELPDPAHFSSSSLVVYFDGIKWRVVIYTTHDLRGDDPKVLARTDTPKEADAIVVEMRTRLDVARSLLGLPI